MSFHEPLLDLNVILGKDSVCVVVDEPIVDLPFAMRFRVAMPDSPFGLAIVPGWRPVQFPRFRAEP